MPTAAGGAGHLRDPLAIHRHNGMGEAHLTLRTIRRQSFPYRIAVWHTRSSFVLLTLDISVGLRHHAQALLHMGSPTGAAAVVFGRASRGRHGSQQRCLLVLDRVPGITKTIDID